jgi:hypothetical protein
LGQNNFSGTIPSLWPPSLIEASFSNNSLTGSLPSLSLPNLVQFHVAANKLTGTLPSYVNCTSLSDFAVNNNSLSGMLVLVQSLCSHFQEVSN